MSNQIVISSGAKVRELEGVLTGTSGIVNALGINVPSGIPQLDGSGKILVSQLPNSVMEYKGSWNAATNTPTLVNGTGNAGDVYLCEVAGTVNFGAGPITFAVGDQVIYSGSIWQRASGATGTVTSVAVTESGDALTITGSPITTSGTINIGFAGTSGQYVNGAGGLTTFPSLTGFVPYTGATASVDLGAFSLTATGVTANSFYAQGNGTQGGYLYLKQGTTPYSTLTGSNSITADGTKYIFFSDAGSSNGKIALFELGSLTNNTNRTFTLPDLSGTLALLEADQIFTGFNFFDYSINYKTGASLTNVSGYISQAYAKSGTGAGSILSLKISDGNSVKAINLDFVGSPATYTFTYPAFSGTMALLEGTQTFSGEKTFGTDITFNGYALMDIGVALAKTSGTPLHASTNGYANLQLVNAGSVNSLYLIDGDTLKYSKLSFNNAADYTYTFPNASGTLALTSNLSSYVPYTGATANVNLGTFDLTADVITGTTGSFASSGGSDTFAINHSSGSGIALNITKGGNGEGLYINKTSGSGNALTVIGSTSLGALSGTSATFSSSVTATQYFASIAAGTSTYAELGRFENTSANSGSKITFYGKQGSDASAKLSGAIGFNQTNNGDSNGQPAFIVETGNNGSISERMRITSGGNVGIGTTSPVTRFHTNTTSGENILLIQAPSTDYSELYFGRASSGVGLYAGFLQYYHVNNSLAFGTNSTERMRITSGGNLCLNTTSTDERFTLNGAIKSKGSLAGYFFEDRTNSTYWYGWYSTGNTNVFFFNGNSGTNIASISPSTGVYTPLSDINKKKDFENSTIGLKEVLQLKPTLYRMKFDETNSSKELGFIAQEVKEFIPQAYVETEDFIGLNYNAIVAALVKSVQEQQAQIEELKAIVATK